MSTLKTQSKNYYFLRQNLFEETNTIEICGHTSETEIYRWLDGIRINADLPVFTLFLDPVYGETFPDFFDTTIPVMSDKLIATLRSAGVDNIDAYPLILKREDTGEEFYNYFVVNIVGHADALDAEKTIVKGKSFKTYHRVHINPDLAKGLKCFRLDHGPELIVIHEEIKKKIEPISFVALFIQNTLDYDGD